VRQALGSLGTERFDYLVNNADISHNNSIEKTTESELDALYNIHFKGAFFLTQKLLPLINNDGRIVNLSMRPCDDHEKWPQVCIVLRKERLKRVADLRRKYRAAAKKIAWPG
jgi:hypothetical protein